MGKNNHIIELFINNGTRQNIEDGLEIEFINLDEFIHIVAGNSEKIPAPHFACEFKYKLISKSGNEYLGNSTFDTYKGIKNNIDEKSPWLVVIKNFKLGKDNNNKSIELVLLPHDGIR